MKHMREPLRLGDGGIFGPWDDALDENPLVAHVENCGMNGPQTEQGYATGKRLVAAYNACKGISTDRLEKMVPGTMANLLTLKGEKK